MNEPSNQVLLQKLGGLTHDARECLGLSLRQVAESIGVVHTTISRFEKGKHHPNHWVLTRLSGVLAEGFVQLGIEADFVQIAYQLGYKQLSFQEQPWSEPDELFNYDVVLDQLVRPSRDLRRNDVELLRWHARPILDANDRRQQARANLLLAASYQEDTSPKAVEDGVFHAHRAVILTKEIGDRFLFELAVWYEIALRRKLVDLTSQELAAYERLRIAAEQLAEDSKFQVIETLSFAELAKYSLSWGADTEFSNWLELGKASAEAAVAKAQSSLTEAESWPSHLAEHAFLIVWDAALRGQGRYGSSSAEKQETLARLAEQHEGMSTNLLHVSIPLGVAEALLRFATSDEQQRRGALMVEGVRQFAEQEGELKQELRARRILAELPEDLRIELAQNRSSHVGALWNVR